MGSRIRFYYCYIESQSTKAKILSMAEDKMFRTGLRNSYRGNMPWSEVITKDIVSLLKSLQYFLGHGKKKPVIVASPDLPGKRTTLHKIAGVLGYRLTNIPLQRAELIVQFDDQTSSHPKMRLSAVQTNMQSS